MRYCLPVFAAVALVSVGMGAARGDAFKAGDVVVYRVGDGSSVLADSAAPVFLDEYTPAGVLVQSVAMPTVGSGVNRALTGTGNSTSEGMLTLSTDGKYLVLGGYDAPVGTATPEDTDSALVNRVVGVVSGAGAVDTSTVMSYAFVGNNIRSVASTNGTDLWVSGTSNAGDTSGIYYTTKGASSGTQVASYATRGVGIYGGQLYAGSTSKSSPTIVAAVGTGTPTTFSVATGLTGLPAGNKGSTNQFVLLDLSPTVAGLDTAYVADDTGTALTKYSLESGTWVATGKIGAGADDYDGLTASVSAGGVVTLFATRLNGGVGGQLVSITDSSGYGGTLAGTVNVLATEGTNESFLGVALTPTVVPEPGIAGVVLVLLGGVMRRRGKGM
ncbi:MAG TPA: hypothetical protein VFE58_17495 [Tepidisphaeraceae bacterium]|jgi:hypothetical protein|nr:hypothetical protein [Tepidisphaeraceae bacterium]